MRYQDLSKEIKQNIFHPVYLFNGPEQYVADMMEKKLIDSTVSSETALLNLNRFTGKDTSVSEVLSICEQFPMMSPYRMVIIDAETGFLSGKSPHEQEMIINYLKNPSPSTILLIKDFRLDKRLKLIKALMAHASVVDFEKLQKNDLEKWIQARFRKNGKISDRTAVDYFINRLMYLENENISMATVDNELNKLIDYCAEKSEITVEDIEMTLPQSIDENIYHMVDAFMSGKTAEALLMLNHFYIGGEDPIGVFALIISQLRTILQIHILSQNHLPPQAIASQVKRPLFVVKKLLQTASKISRNRLFDYYHDAALLDWQIKTGAVEPAPAVELFLVKLSCQI